jgi:type VI protein secretion system component Hcp
MRLPSLLRHLSYANVASSLCLFMLLGGSAYAAVRVTGADVKNGSLTSADIKDHSLRARDFRAGELPAGPAGPKGDPGRDGAAGAPGPIASPPAPRSSAPAGRLTLAGITGDGPGGTIEVRSIAWSNTVTAGAVGGGGAPKPVFGDVQLTKAPDRSSAELWKHTATGQHMATGKLELLAPGAGAAYATYGFKDLTVKAFSTEGAGDRRQDEVQLAFDPLSAPTVAFDAAAPLPALSEPRVGQMAVDGLAGETGLVLDAWNIAGGTMVAGGGAGGAATFGPFVVSKGVDAATPELFKRYLTGLHTRTVTVKLLQPGSTTVYTTYVLTDVAISSFAVVGDGRPLERIGLDAARIESTTPVAGGAAVRSCFDRKLQMTC